MKIARIKRNLGRTFAARVVLFASGATLVGGCSESPAPVAKAPVAAKSRAETAGSAKVARPWGEAARSPLKFDENDIVPWETPPIKSAKNSRSAKTARAAEPAKSKEPTATVNAEKPGRETSHSATSPHAEQSAEATVAIPTSLAKAMQLVDLRQLARLPETHSTVDSPTQASLTVKASLAEAKQFYSNLLTQAGWQLVTSATGAGDSEDYAQLDFSKAGFQLGVSLNRSADTNFTSIGLNNFGNVDVRTLPLPAGSQTLYSNFHVAMYVTDAKVPQVAEACIERLEAAGWQHYVRPFTAYPEDAQRRLLTFVRNGLSLSAAVAVAPARMHRTTVEYSVRMLGDELPIPADARQIEFLESPLQLKCETNESLLATLEFFRQELTARGWHERGTDQPAGHESISVFQRSEGLPIVLKITRFGTNSQTRVSIAEFEVLEVSSTNRGSAGATMRQVSLWE
jgi:hypothetical protein